MKKRGVGIAAGLYPTGLMGGGDPSQAIVKIKPDGSVDLIIGSTDIGQGCKTVFAQMAAEELGVSVAQVNVLNADTDAGPLCLGTFASRVTVISGNAVIAAAKGLGVFSLNRQPKHWKRLRQIWWPLKEKSL